MHVKFSLEDLEKELDKGLRLVRVEVEYWKPQDQVNARIVPPEVLQLVIEKRYHPRSLHVSGEPPLIGTSLSWLADWIRSVKEHAEAVEKQCVNLIKALKKLAVSEEVKT